MVRLDLQNTLLIKFCTNFDSIIKKGRESGPFLLWILATYGKQALKAFAFGPLIKLAVLAKKSSVDG